MDFMQCINFKSRLEREREMIRRKIRSSTLYRKPSFTKSAFNIYNPNNDVTKVSVISKNLKINDFRDEPLRKTKSPLLVNDEQEDECSNEEKSILCIAGNKYLDLTSNLISSSIVKSMSTSTLNLLNDEHRVENDFERAISQSHLSPTAAAMNIHSSNQMMKKSSGDVQENLKKPKTATINISNNNLNNKSLFKSDIERTSDGDDASAQDMTQSPSEKRKTHKIIKKSALLYNSHHHHGCGKYSDAQKTEVALDDLPSNLNNNNNNSITNNSLITSSTSNVTNNINVNSTTNTVKTAKKNSATVTRKNKSSKSSATTRKSENS